MKHLFYRLFYTKHYSIILCGIFYIVFLKATTIAYCSWFDNMNVYWNFPLEQDEANKSWQEGPSDEIINKRWLHLNEHQSRIQEQQKMAYEDKLIKRLIENNKAKLMETNTSKEDIAFIKALQSFSQRDKAIAINGRLFDTIIAMIQSTPNNKLNNETIKQIVFKVIAEDCTLKLWLCKTEQELKSDNSVINHMISSNYQSRASGALNRAEIDILLHMTTTTQILNSCSVVGFDPRIMINNATQYTGMYNANKTFIVV